MLTPHIQPGLYDNTMGNIRTAVLSFEKKLVAENIDLDIRFAAEIRLCPEIPEMVNQGQLPMLGEWDGSRVFLLYRQPACSHRRPQRAAHR